MRFELQVSDATIYIPTIQLAKRHHKSLGGLLFVEHEGRSVAITADPEDDTLWNRQVRGGVKVLRGH